MDVLSDALMAVRTGRPISMRNEYPRRWGTRFLARDGIGFHVVLQGACWFLPPSGPPVALVPGDFVVLPHGDEHGLANDPRSRPPSYRWTIRPTPSRPRSRQTNGLASGRRRVASGTGRSCSAVPI